MMVLLIIDEADRQHMPPPALTDEFPISVHLVKTGEEGEPQYAPPPLCAELPMIVQKVNTGEE
jgi:hypothetical protein